MNWYLGTMGFAYRDWEGGLYPELMPSRNYLGHYSRFFNAVEIDSTFYGTPKEEVVYRWSAVVPEEFQFCLKTPRVITHELGLVNASDEMHLFVSTARLLEQRLGVILLQFPPSFKVDRLEILSDFLPVLATDLRFAIEFRDQSWYTAASEDEEPPVFELLRKYNVCWATTDYPGVPSQVYQTASFLYIRWIGQHGKYPHHQYERVDLTPRLFWWWQQFQDYLEGVEAVFGFFNNDYAGHAPTTCNRFKAIANLPLEDITPPRQGRLL